MKTFNFFMLVLIFWIVSDHLHAQTFTIDSVSDDGNSNANFPASNAIDGDLSWPSRWAANFSEVDSVNLYVDLGTPQNISDVGIAFGRGDQRSYVFEIWARPGTTGAWTRIFSDASSGTIAGIEQFNVDDVSARQVSINVYSNSAGTDWADIIEFEAYGENGPSDNGGVTNDCPQQDSFSDQSDLVTASCDENYVYIHTDTGLPEISDTADINQTMIGITAWINRVAVPFEYNWIIPRNPIFLHTYEEATAQGPIAFAVNGVPIFHLEARPDASTNPEDYNPNTDTVLTGELDQCGGHSGQGEDYHYHYAPVCLLDEHDLSKPIAYGLDGIPIYYGTGGNNYYGRGRYNNLRELYIDCPKT